MCVCDPDLSRLRSGQFEFDHTHRVLIHRVLRGRHLFTKHNQQQRNFGALPHVPTAASYVSCLTLSAFFFGSPLCSVLFSRHKQAREDEVCMVLHRPDSGASRGNAR